MLQAESSVEQTTLVQNIKNFDINGVWRSISQMNLNWMQMGIFFIIGALSGFLFKKYFKTLFLWTICGVGLVAALEYGGFIAIDWHAVQSVVGVAPSQSFDSVFHSWLAWAQVNMSLLACAVLGFMLGHKLA